MDDATRQGERIAYGCLIAFVLLVTVGVGLLLWYAP